MIAGLNQRLAKLQADHQTVQAHPGPALSLGGRPRHPDDAFAILGQQLERLPARIREPLRKPLGEFRGLAFGLELHPSFPPEVYVEGETTLSDQVSRDRPGPRAVLNALNRLADQFDRELEKVCERLAVAERQLHDYQARLGTAFPHDDYLQRLTTLRDQLKNGLSTNTNSIEPPPESSLTDIAARIKSLRSSHTLDHTAERSPPKHSTAETPITFRIRERREGRIEPISKIGENGTPGRDATSHGITSTAPLSFQERHVAEHRSVESIHGPA